MSILGPYTGDKSKAGSYQYGPHWQGMKGYRVVDARQCPRETENYRHQFGGSFWKVPTCEKCHTPLHQILTFDLSDPRLAILHTEGLADLPLVSCVNCSAYWEPQVFQLDLQDKAVKVIAQNDTQDFAQDPEDRLPSPLPLVPAGLTELKPEDIPGDRESYNQAWGLFGSEYIARLLGPPLYSQNPPDRECPLCKKEMTYVGMITSENYDESGKLIPGVPFLLGEISLYFLFCKDCLILKTEAQGT